MTILGYMVGIWLLILFLIFMEIAHSKGTDEDKQSIYLFCFIVLLPPIVVIFGLLSMIN